MKQMYIQIGRLDDNKRVEVEDGATLNAALNVAGYKKADNEEFQDIEGNKYDGNEEVESGKGYFLVQRVKSGQ